MFRVPFISCLTFLAIASCSASRPIDPQAAAAANLPDVDVPAPSAAGEPHGSTEPARPGPAPHSSIPAPLEGRWALAPVDCTAPQALAKGLLVITPTDLRFRESRAVPANDIESDGESIAGNFEFTGEGRSWTRFQALKVEKGVLTRLETHPTASFSYAKCS